jgi:predicted RNase H-like HicB family nuclease
MIAKNLQDMFRAEKTDKCCVCLAPIPHCEYEAEGICVFPFDPDDRPNICSRCPLGMCHMCRVSRRIEARYVEQVDTVLYAEAQKILSRPYKRTFIPEDNGFSASMPELPGCFTCGESLPEAYENLHEAALGWIAACLEAGEIVPNPEMEE